MAFNLIRTCRHHSLKSLSNEYFTAETLFGGPKVFSREFTQFVTVNPDYLCKFSHKEDTKICSKTFFASNFLRSFSTNSVGITTTSCPLRIFFPANLQPDAKLLMKFYSTNPSESDEPQLSNKDKLKRAVKEYGATVIIFHVSISLVSLGVCYLAVTSGLNVGDYISGVGLNGSSEIATEAGLFVVAYAVHKVLAPVRIGITLAATPIIVRYLRKINILKPPKPS